MSTKHKVNIKYWKYNTFCFKMPERQVIIPEAEDQGTVR